jgi:hypothetical protein
MRACLAVLLLTFGLPCAADWGKFEYEFEEAKDWNEIQTQLPGAPQTADLVRIDVGPTVSHEYFVDSRSVSSGSDGVVRYSVLVKASGGAQSVSFEGMRCESSEVKLYAFGRPDGSWSRNKYARWSAIKARATGGYHRELFFHYFCTVDGIGDLKTITKALRQGGLRRGESPSF